ncbi:efflux RND transporter permease subunit [Thiohalomonas denitrificans]|uniref:Multidrug efflux pump subunit AcrB n=1 Tax=Thiohalomonas denitrificans TaxID=415747 RepID=A0A1G5PQV9_9GAMM|nr:efflux RND transporter permease subunit [Thiohalomonas denitrificans]SCZ51778.1 Multidrug efflux pump subunit AcrB [Thiohalomonas denitrificans]
MSNPRDGIIGWMVRNRVTSNLLMLIFLIGGLFFSLQIKKEVFPEFELDRVTISVAYPGASPEEVESGILLVLEESIRGVSGVDEMTATASEGSGSLSAELSADAEPMRVYQDIRQAVDRITTFPEEAEDPSIALAEHKRQVMGVSLFGEVDAWVMRGWAEEVRDRLLQDPGITEVELSGAREYEVRVTMDREMLRRHGLTLGDVADTIAASSVELPGGGIETSGGELLLRVAQRADWARQFAMIPLRTSDNGAVVRLEDVAEVREELAETDRYATYNGQPSIGLRVFRVGQQTPLDVSAAVKQVMADLEPELPSALALDVDYDRSDIYAQRMELLLKNAFIGLLLVLILLGLFLEFKLAFWVTLGIPISFLGAFLFLPAMDVSINMVSMFAFIIALGIVVDDAIIAGENIYEYRQRGMGFIEAAIEGSRSVVMPLSFAILTNIVAFLPLLFVPGFMGKMFAVIPAVVGTVFLISWVEAVLILPTHLAHSNPEHKFALSRMLYRRQQRIAAGLARFVKTRYRPVLERALGFRYAMVAAGLAVLILVIGYAASGRLGFNLMPRVESDRAVVTATLPYGTPLAHAEQVRDRLVSAAERVIAEVGDDQLLEGMETEIDENVVEVFVELAPEDVREISTSEVTRRWRQAVGPLANVDALRFQSNRGGPGGGAALSVELTHRENETLNRASERLTRLLADYPNVTDIQNGYTPGKEQLSFRVLPAGRDLGLTAREVARQVRHAFYGAEALRQQRGRNEIKVMVGLPRSQRLSEYDLEQLMVRTPAGAYVPLLAVVEVDRGRAYTSIERRNARRTVTVTADVEPFEQTNQMLSALKADTLPDLVSDFPGLSYSFQGQQADTAEGTSSMLAGFVIMLIVLYAMLAIPFRSYSQPMLVLAAIPFGIVGAVLGHLIMGYGLSMVSVMGAVALAGVVVNDSLVLIDYSNRRRDAGLSAHDAIVEAGVRRFRPVLLTTLTTFGGLAPMIFETSRQARFLIPMAISLGYGILFATLITLLLVPALYLVLEDIGLGWRAPSRDEGRHLEPAEIDQGAE